ncbi:MAG: multidrug effflux MFS transporter [Sporolactobacillus sp.]
MESRHTDTDSVDVPQRGFGQVTARQHIGFILVLGALGAFGPLSMDMYLPALPALTRNLQTSPSLAQLSITACLIGLALGQIIIGPLSDARGRRAPLIAGLIIFTVTSLLCTMVHSIFWLVLLRLLQGLAGSAGMVISRAVARDLYSGPALMKFFAMLMAINGVFPILSPVMGGILLKFTDWRGVFVTLTVIGGLLLIGTLTNVPETLPKERRIRGGIRSSLHVIGTIAKDRQFMGYAGVQGLVMGAMFCYISGSSFALQNIFHLSPFVFSLVFAVNGTGIVCMSQLAGVLARRVDGKRILRVAVTIAFAGSLALSASLLLPHPFLPAVLIPLFFIVAMVGLVNATAFSLALQSQGAAAGSAAAMLGMGMNLIGALLSPLVGVLGSGTYLPMALLILLCDGGALLIYRLAVCPRTSRERHD